MAWKITRPTDSNRLFAFGLELQGGESAWIDDETVARRFQGVGWHAAKEDAPAGVKVIRCQASQSLRAVMDPDKLKRAGDPRGPWKITAPEGWTRFYVQGYEVRNGPFTVTRADDMVVFKDLGFIIEKLDVPHETQAKIAPHTTYARPGDS